MIYLSESALKYAVNICEELPGYKVGIALSSKNGYDIMQVIVDAITDAKATIYFIDNNKHRIEFSNGSTIQFIPTCNNNILVKGYVMHLLVVEHNIDKEFVSCVLRPYEKLDYYLNHLKGQSVNRLKGQNKC